MDSDNALISKYQQGDLSAFETLYRRYKDGIYNYLCSIVKSTAIAEEIMQDIFTEFISRINEIKAEGNFKNFLYVSARNRAINHHKREKRNIGSGNMELLEPIMNTSIEEKLQCEEEARRINDCMANLPDEQREVILLKIYQEFTFREIAELVNESIGTVSSRYNYGLEKLRNLLATESTER